MCEKGYALKKEEAVRKLLDQALEVADIDGACLVGSMIESDILADVILALIKYNTVMRYKVMRNAGDQSMDLDDVEAQVRDEVLKRLTVKLKKSMRALERIEMRN